MRLALFRTLSSEQQKIEVKKALAEIREARKWLDKNGIWTVPTRKQLRESGEPITLWSANKE